MSKTHKRENYIKALERLRDAVTEPINNDRDVAGLVKGFEFVYELSWKYLKHLLEQEGVEAGTPKSVFRAAFSFGFIESEDIWLEIIGYRNKTSHTYDQVLAFELMERIEDCFLVEFQKILDIKGS